MVLVFFLHCSCIFLFLHGSFFFLHCPDFCLNSLGRGAAIFFADVVFLSTELVSTPPSYMHLYCVCLCDTVVLRSLLTNPDK